MAGEILKKRREDLEMTIKEVADGLKIRKDYLEAIENDAFEKLPVAVYTIGYIRAYASLLQVEAEPIIDVYSGHLSKPAPSTIVPVSSSKKKTPRFLAAVLVMLVLAVGFYIYMYGANVFMNKKAFSGPKQRVEPAGTPSVAPSAMHSVTAPAQTAIPAQVSSVLPAEHVLHITATEPTWLSVRINNKKEEEVTLRPGEAKDWRFPEKAVLRVGNAGGIRVVFDEKEMGPLGGRGQVTTLVLPPEVH